MTAPAATGREVFGAVATDAPSARVWVWASLAAVIAHLAAAIPFLGDPAPPPMEMAEGPGIGVTLALVIAPPEPPPATEPEPVQEEPVIEERAAASPPPAPPAKPREAPDIPDIRPQAIPDLWRGAGVGAGTLSLEDYLALEPWLAEARQTVLEQLSYPIEARKLRISGVAEVIVTSDRNGRIIAWSFTRRTGEPILDREIERSLSRVRRLPKFPDQLAYEKLSFTLPMRFELVYQGEVISPADEAPAAPPPPVEGQLTATELAQCAAQAAALVDTQTALAAQRAELEALGAEYEREAQRFQRDGREIPIRVRSILRRYDEGADAYEAAIAAFDGQAATFAASCGKGSADWETYRRACLAYVATGNRYCEAFGQLWARLIATR